MAKNIKIKEVGDGYEVIEDYLFYSKRYKKFLLIHKDFYSDGATDAIDIDSDSWIVHDFICRYGEWSDKTKINNWQASMVIHDILEEEGYWFRKYTWFWMTWLLGGGAARDNGLT